MNNPIDEISIADQLLKQLQDQYLAVHSQDIVMPKQNIEPEEDSQNPYQPLQFQDEQNYQQKSQDSEENSQENQVQNKLNVDESQKPQDDIQNFKRQIESLRIQQANSNPQIKELIQVPPINQKIFNDLPIKDFEIDQQKIKAFALSMDINQPDWLKNQNLCKVRIQELFMKKPIGKAFTKM